MCQNQEIFMMQETDIKEIEELEERCFSEPWNESILSDILNHSYDYAWTVRQNGMLVAYCNLRVIGDEGEIMRIAVLPEYRHQGIARKLMEEMLKFAKKERCEAILLEVRAGNTSARQLYQSFGFEIDGIRKNYYHHPQEDAVLMGLRSLG